MLPSSLPWQQGDLLGWPETILAGGKRWSRYIGFSDQAANPDGVVLSAYGPEGRQIYQGEDEAACDGAVRSDILDRIRQGTLARPSAPIS